MESSFQESFGLVGRYEGPQLIWFRCGLLAIVVRVLILCESGMFAGGFALALDISLSTDATSCFNKVATLNVTRESSALFCCVPEKAGCSVIVSLQFSSSLLLV